MDGRRFLNWLEAEMREGGWLPTFPTVRAVFDCLISHRLRRRQRAQEIAEVVSERMKLEPHGVGRERPARQPCPLDRALAFLDPLFARPALVIERNDPLGRAAHVRHDEADARIQFARMPLKDLPAAGGLSALRGCGSNGRSRIVIDNHDVGAVGATRR